MTHEIRLLKQQFELRDRLVVVNKFLSHFLDETSGLMFEKALGQCIKSSNAQPPFLDATVHDVAK